MPTKTITNKQKEILLLIYRFRFLNRIQIQKLLNHKNPKNTNVWLKNLVTGGYLNRIYERKAGINISAIYYISKNGIKFLRTLDAVEKEYLTKLYQENRKSQTFILQCLIIADIYLKLSENNQKSFKFYTKTDFPVKSYIRDLSPSFAYVLEINGSLENFSCEVINPGLPRFAIRSRINHYFEFFRPINDQPINIIFYCLSEKLANYAIKYAQKIVDEDNCDNIRFQSVFMENHLQTLI